jgi:hypothetical protein
MIILLMVAVIIGLGVFGYAKKYWVKPTKIHYHAGFEVYVNGVLQDFSSDQYMYFGDCSIAPPSKVVNQIDKAHLHDNVGNVVHVHANNAVWGDLFTNIKFTIDPTLPIEAYVNGQLINDLLNTPIKPYDSLILLIGTHGPVADYLAHQVTMDQIKKVEQTSEGCGN